MTKTRKFPIAFKDRFAYHFSLDNAADQDKIIEQPTFGENLVKQFEFIKEYRNRYNTVIKAKREPLLFQLEKLRVAKEAAKGKEQATRLKEQISDIKKELSQECNQLIRDVHVNLFKEIVCKARQQVGYNNAYLHAEGFNKIDPAKPYYVQCSYPELAHRTGGAAQKTIYRRLVRLQTAGFFGQLEGVCGPISGKRFRGTNAPFELLIKPGMLLIYDKKDPNYLPKLSLPATEKWAFPFHDSTNGHHISSLNNTEISLIEGIRNEAELHGHKSAKAEKENPLNRTPKSGVKTKRNQKLGAPGEKQKIKEALAEKKSVLRPANFDNDLEKYAFAQAVTFLQAAITALWGKLSLQPGYICKVEDQIYSTFFKNFHSEASIDQRKRQMLEIILHNKKYIEAKPGERFAMLPHLYFSKKRKKTGKDDYAGFYGQVRLIKAKQDWDKFSESKKQQALEQQKNRQKTKFLQALRRYHRNEKGYSQAARLKKFVAQNAPIFTQQLDKYLAFGEWPTDECMASKPRTKL
jgi:restriction endonuclease Mrr